MGDRASRGAVGLNTPPPAPRWGGPKAKRFFDRLTPSTAVLTVLVVLVVVLAVNVALYYLVYAPSMAPGATPSLLAPESAGSGSGDEGRERTTHNAPAVLVGAGDIAKCSS